MIAIIGVLAAIIIPVVGKVRASARGARCLSNLRQIGGLFQNFANDNKDSLPYASGPQYSDKTADQPHFSWSYTLATYITPKVQIDALVTRAKDNAGNNGDVKPLEILDCPAANFGLGNAPEGYFSAYAANGTLLGRYQPPGEPFPKKVKFGKIPAPSLTYLVADANERAFIYTRPQAFTSRPGSWKGYVTDKSAVERHDGKINMLFVDGSVRSLQFSQMLFHPDIHGSRPPWGF